MTFPFRKAGCLVALALVLQQSQPLQAGQSWWQWFKTGIVGALLVSGQVLPARADGTAQPKASRAASAGGRLRSVKRQMAAVSALYPPETCPGLELVCPECPGPMGELDLVEPQAPIKPDWEAYGWRLGGAASFDDHVPRAKTLARKLDNAVCRLSRRYYHPLETSSSHRKIVLARQLGDARHLYGLLEKEIVENQRMKVTFQSRLGTGWEALADPSAISLERRIAAIDESLRILEPAKEKYLSAELDLLDARLAVDAQERAEKEKERLEKEKLKALELGEGEAEAEPEAEAEEPEAED